MPGQNAPGGSSMVAVGAARRAEVTAPGGRGSRPPWSGALAAAFQQPVRYVAALEQLQDRPPPGVPARVSNVILRCESVEPDPAELVVGASCLSLRLGSVHAAQHSGVRSSTISVPARCSSGQQRPRSHVCSARCVCRLQLPDASIRSARAAAEPAHGRKYELSIGRILRVVGGDGRSGAAARHDPRGSQAVGVDRRGAELRTPAGRRGVPGTQQGNRGVEFGQARAHRGKAVEASSCLSASSGAWE